MVAVTEGIETQVVADPGRVQRIAHFREQGHLLGFRRLWSTERQADAVDELAIRQIHNSADEVPVWQIPASTLQPQAPQRLRLDFDDRLLAALSRQPRQQRLNDDDSGTERPHQNPG